MECPASNEAVLENLPEMGSKTFMRRDTVSTASPSDLEVSDEESGDENGNTQLSVLVEKTCKDVSSEVATKHAEETLTPQATKSPHKKVGNLDVTTVTNMILESLDKVKAAKAAKAGSVPSTPTKRASNQTAIQSPSGLMSSSVMPPLHTSPGKPPMTPRNPGVLKKATLPRIPRTPITTLKVPGTPGTPSTPIVSGSPKPPSTPNTPGTPGTPFGESPNGLATKICEKTADPVWHPDFWCADLLDFEEDAPRTGSAEFSNEFSIDSRDDKEFIEDDDDDESSVITDISALSDDLAEFLDNIEAVPGTTVRFKDIFIREYDQILGDHPACSNGPSISIGWTYKEHPPLRVKHFEALRRRVGRKSKMLLSRRSREKMLTRLGYSGDDIADAIRDNNKIRTQRRQTANNMGGSEKLGKAMQTAARKMKSLFSISRRRRR